MKNIKTISILDLNKIKSFIFDNIDDFKYFLNIGWTQKNIENHLRKKNNFSLAYFSKNNIDGIVFGEKIKNDNGYDLEIHIIFVTTKKRRNKVATNILNFIVAGKNSTKISKIYLEVSENNAEAIKFYEKNNFVFYKFRHNYYRYNNKIINAKCYLKLI